MAHPTPTTTLALQIFGTTALLASGGALVHSSLIDIPIFRSQPASRSLLMIRWYFSRGSHFFPQAAELSCIAFGYLAYTTVNSVNASSALTSLPALGYIVAAACPATMGLMTRFYMYPKTNKEILQLTDEIGGARSQVDAQIKREKGRDAQASEFRDTSDPQTEADGKVTPQQEKRVQELLNSFQNINGVRAALMLGGGVAGLLAALVA